MGADEIQNSPEQTSNRPKIELTLNQPNVREQLAGMAEKGRLEQMKQARITVEAMPAGVDDSNWERLLEARAVIKESPPPQDLPVYYPAARRDIPQALALTDATNFVFSDYAYVNEQGIPDPNMMPDAVLKGMGAEITSDQTVGTLGKGGKRVLTFRFGGKERKLTLYAEDMLTFAPEEIANGTAADLMIGVDLGEGPNGHRTNPAEVTRYLAKTYKNIAIGGVTNLFPGNLISPEQLGFKLVYTPKPDANGQPVGQPIYRKVAAVDNLEQKLAGAMGT